MFHIQWLVLQIETSSQRIIKVLYLWIIAQLSVLDKIICLLHWQWSAIARKYIIFTAMYRNMLVIPHVAPACVQVMDPAHGFGCVPAALHRCSDWVSKRCACKWITSRHDSLSYGIYSVCVCAYIVFIVYRVCS